MLRVIPAAVLAAHVALAGWGTPKSIEEVSDRITKVERPGVGRPGPFIIVSLVSDDEVEDTFKTLVDVVKWQVAHGDHDYQQFIFRLAIPAQDNWGNKGISPAMDILFYADRAKLEAMDWTKVTPKDLLKISRADHITHPGMQWGQAYCGNDRATAHAIAFCAGFIR